MAQRSGSMESCAYGSCIHYWSGTLINTSRLFFRLARSNLCARQEKLYDKTDSKGHISQKQHSENPGINAPEFLWLEKIGYKLYKTLPYHPQFNGSAERIVQTIKMALKACSQQKEKKRTFYIKAAFKLSHNTLNSQCFDHLFSNVLLYLLWNH